MTSAELLIIGVGNPLMADDGIGVAVAEHLAGEALPDGVRVIEAGAIGLALLDLWEGYERVWLVDAVRMGQMPGECRWMEVEDLSGLASEEFDAHAGLGGVLRLALALERLPDGFRLLGVEPGRIRAGEDLSPAGREGCQQALQMLRSALKTDL